MQSTTASPLARVAGALTSRIGRRFVLMFALCALMPLIVFAFVAVTRVSNHVRMETIRNLHGAAKNAGMTIAGRLDQVANDLTLAGDLAHSWRTEGAWSGGETLKGQVSKRCAGIWLIDRERVEAMVGELALPQIALSQDQLKHLRAGKKVLQVMPGTSEFLMSHDIDPSDEQDTRVVALIESDWFWDPQVLRGVDCEFVVCDESGQNLFHTLPEPPDTNAIGAATAGKQASGELDWMVAGQPHIARFWRAFMSPQYTLDFYVLQSQSQADAFAVDHESVRFFWLVAIGTLLVVLLGSLVQMRRTLDPIVTLRDATQRLGQGDLDVRVEIESRDEFGDLGSAFNEMTQRLQVNIRQREQTERELVASRDAALAAVKAKAEFVTNVSHEFRTPMAEILGATEILSQMDASEDVAVREEFSGIALHGAQRLARLLDDVLELGRVSAGTHALIDIGASVAAAVSRMPPESRERVVCQVDEETPCVLGDGNRITETWCRLLDNAAKFSAPGTLIEVRVGRAATRAIVEVIDHGVGIAKEDLERVFEPFSQVGRDQMINKAHGTGLGLTLARAAIESCGGKITVRSELGHGTTFRVSLPVEVPLPARV